MLGREPAAPGRAEFFSHAARVTLRVLGNGGGTVVSYRQPHLRALKAAVTILDWCCLNLRPLRTDEGSDPLGEL